MQFYHHPRCRKSREALALLRDKGIEPEIVLYLQDTPSRQEIKALLKKLGMPARDLVRRGEPIFREKYKGRELSEAEWIDALAGHPQLLERPILVKGDKAVVGRPPEKVLDLIA